MTGLLAVLAWRGSTPGRLMLLAMPARMLAEGARLGRNLGLLPPHPLFDPGHCIGPVLYQPILNYAISRRRQSLRSASRWAGSRGGARSARARSTTSDPGGPAPARRPRAPEPHQAPRGLPPLGRERARLAHRLPRSRKCAPERRRQAAGRLPQERTTGLPRCRHRRHGCRRRDAAAIRLKAGLPTRPRAGQHRTSSGSATDARQRRCGRLRFGGGSLRN